MDNQHKKIKTYRDLTQSDIDDMNSIKDIESQIGKLLKDLSANQKYDQRCFAIARTELQKGFMFAVRAIAQPASDL
jgi:hypothetical protein